MSGKQGGIQASSLLGFMGLEFLVPLSCHGVWSHRWSGLTRFMDYGKENRQTAVLRFVFETKIITRGFVVVKCSLSLRWSILFVLLKNRGCPPKILLKRTRGLLNKEIFLFGISALGVF
jgi:hypothetical protein